MPIGDFLRGFTRTGGIIAEQQRRDERAKQRLKLLQQGIKLREEEAVFKREEFQESLRERMFSEAGVERERKARQSLSEQLGGRTIEAPQIETEPADPVMGTRPVAEPGRDIRSQLALLGKTRQATAGLPELQEPTEGADFTLGQGQGRFTAEGEPIVQVAPKQTQARAPTVLELAMEAEDVTFDTMTAEKAVKVLTRVGEIRKQGAPSVNIDIGKTSPTDIATPRAQLRALDDIEKRFNSRFVGKFDDLFAKGAEALGINLSREENEFRSEVGVFGIETRRFYAGTAQSEAELKSLRDVIPDTKNTENKFKANISATRRNIQRKLTEIINVLQFTTNPQERKRLEALKTMGETLLGGKGGATGGTTGRTTGGTTTRTLSDGTVIEERIVP